MTKSEKMKYIKENDLINLLKFRDFYHEEVANVGKHACAHCDQFGLLKPKCQRLNRSLIVFVVNCPKIEKFMKDIF